MCEKLVKKNVKAPAFVYKVVKNSNLGFYKTPCANARLYPNTVNKAKNFRESSPQMGGVCWASYHQGKFASFKTKGDAKIYADYEADNWIVVKCVPGGEIHQTEHEWLSRPNGGTIPCYLSETLEIVEEVNYRRKIK